MEICEDFLCVAGMSLTCAPSTQCMDAFCDAITGCSETPRPDGTPCNDGEAFTKNDVCSASGTVCSGVVPQCREVKCKKGDFWCELTKILSEVVGKIDKDRKRACL